MYVKFSTATDLFCHVQAYNTLYRADCLVASIVIVHVQEHTIHTTTTYPVKHGLSP